MFTEFVEAAWAVLLELAPWLLLGAAAAGVLHVVLPQGFIERQLSGRAGVLKAVGLGVPLPLCSCSVIPTGLGLRHQGADRGATVGFLISTPQTGVDSVLVSASMLGWPFALFKLASAAVLGAVGGFVTNAVTAERREGAGSGAKAGGAKQGGAKQGGAKAGDAKAGDAKAGGAVDSDARNAPGEENASRNASAERAGARPTMREGLEHAVMLVRTIWRWLAVGVLASAALTAWLPADAFAGAASYGGALAVVGVLAISVPLYVCATASVPIAAALVAAGLPAGAALVFLMAGPATNVATIGAVYRTFGLRTLAVYLVTIVGGSVGLALVFDFVLTADPVALAHAHEQGGIVAQASAVLLLAAFGYFGASEARSFFRRRGVKRAGGSAAKDRSSSVSAAVEVPVGGLTCQGCVRKLEGKLSELEGVEGAEVDLDPGRARVRGNVPLEALKGAIRDAGFRPEDGEADASGAPSH